MNQKTYPLGAPLLGMTFLLFVIHLSSGEPPVRTNLFFTGFESHEGYVAGAILHGQNGWSDEPVNEGVIDESVVATGIEVETFPGYGQQAWIGAAPNEDGTPDPTPAPVEFVSAWRSTPLDPVPAETPIVKFSVLMAIIDSNNEKWDQFHWAVFNTSTQRLFSVIFENKFLFTAYELDDGTVEAETTPEYPVDTIMQLDITMHFAQNKWSATLEGVPIATDQPISTTGLEPNLGQIRALWLPEDVNTPGNNYMPFDNFTLFAESEPTVPVPPTLLSLGTLSDGGQAVRLIGEPDCKYVVDFSTDGTSWTAMRTNIAVDGVFDFVDTNAPTIPYRFFRARLVSP